MKIGPYEVLGELGRGGMGVVYRVRSPDGRDAALKLLLRADPATLARFERERRLLASLGEEEGFVGLLDAGASPEGAWLVMPFVPGGTLRQKLERGPLGVGETIALGLDLATALGRAHERGTVHRDVKPENILFAASGHPLLADLGLAKHFDRLAKGASHSVELTERGVFKGTAGYVAPEQLADAASAGPAADVFALGAVLHECLAGRPAFTGETVVDVITRLCSGIVEPIGRPDVPASLEAVVRRALAQDPRERFASGLDLARALGDLRGSSRGAGKARPRRAVLAPVVVGAALGVSVLAAGVIVLGRRRAETAAPERPNERRGDAVVSPRPPSTALALSARELADRAREKTRRGDGDGAIDDATKAIELDPELAVAWANRGLARNQKGDWDGAIADLTKAIELDPGNIEAWLNRDAAHAYKGDWDGAIADATKAIELAPGLALAWADRGRARFERGDWDGAIDDLTRAIALDPTVARPWTIRGVARANTGDGDGAIADQTKAVELDPKLATAWANLGSALGRRGDWDGEIADVTKAIELDPRSSAYRANRGVARGEKGDWDGAIADLTKAIELDPRNASAFMNRGFARVQKGDRDGAIADYERSLELDPGGPAAADARTLLEDARKQRAR